MAINPFDPTHSDDLTFDLAIVGSGPAGLAVACEFLSTGLNVAVLESGEMERTSEADELNDIESVGHARAPHAMVNMRGLGGTSALWTGRCGELDYIDYHARPWLPNTGWPISHDTLSPYFQRAGKFLGLASTLSGDMAARELARSFDSPPFRSSLFKPVVWQFSSPHAGTPPEVRHFTPEGQMPTQLLQHTGAPKAVNVGDQYRMALASSRSVHVFTSTTVCEILVNEETGRAAGLKACNREGASFEVSAPFVVLAAGGIQNPRLLLASRSLTPNGLGNDHDMVGRYLTDHHFSEIAVFRDVKAAGIRRRLGNRWHPALGSRRIFSMGLRLSEEAQRQQALLNASIHLVEFGSKANALSTLAGGARHLKGGRVVEAARDVFSGLSRPVGLVRGAADRFLGGYPPLNEPERSVVGCVVEQDLQCDSRVTLSDRVDRFGLPLARVDWRVSEREFRTVRTVEKAFHSEAVRLGSGPYERPDWRNGNIGAWTANLVDLAHPSCSTRMSRESNVGVVDENCQVHGILGLYVAGSSVFATNSHMNPTQTLVALSLRLADHIKERVKLERPKTAMLNSQRRIRFGFIGGGHRVETIYAPVMKALSEEVEVCGVATSSPEGAKRISQKTGWVGGTDSRALVEREKPDGLIVAVPPGSVDSVYLGLVELGVPLLLETPACWNERTGRRLLKEGRKRKLLAGVAEQFPFLPEFQLQRKLISLGLIGHVKSVVNNFAVYDYHGIALLRSLLGSDRKPVAAQAVYLNMGQNERWLMGSFTMDDGSFAAHAYSPAYEKVHHRDSGGLKVYGSAGTLLPGEARFEMGNSKSMVSKIFREEERGELKSLHVDTIDGVVRWENPFLGHGLTDEQIAVGCLVRSMADAIRYSGACAYPYWSALEDVEILNAMRYSAQRGGLRINLPASPLRQKVLVRAQALASRRRRA